MAKLSELVAKLGVPACYGSSLSLNPGISQKYKIGDISKRVSKTLKPAKKVSKKRDFHCNATEKAKVLLNIGL